MKKRQKRKSIRSFAALSAAFALSAPTAVAAARTLPTPPPSPWPDTESSSVAAMPDRRKLTVKIAWLPTPTNCIQVAFGQDRNADEDLAPEETDLVLGIDCGLPFIRDEKSKGEVEQWSDSPFFVAFEQEGDHLCSTSTSTSTSASPSTFTFALKQPKAASSRWTIAKATTRGRGPTTNATITINWQDPFVLLIR